jgi:uncharacterized integral membrane protein (TIGR00697 family)
VNFDRRTQLFVALASTFVTCLVVGDIIGVKLFQFDDAGRFVISLGMVPFPVTFLLTDLLNEFYGKRAAHFVTWVGFGMAVLTFMTVQLVVALPAAPFMFKADWSGTLPSAIDNVFGGSKRILFASMVAYVAGQLLDIAVFNALKRLTKNKMLWLRATGSTAVSQFMDTVVVQIIAWAGVLDAGKIASLVITSYVVKLAVAIGLTPLIYAGHTLMERWMNLQPVRLDERGEPIVAPAPADVP